MNIVATEILTTGMFLLNMIIVTFQKSIQMKRIHDDIARYHESKCALNRSLKMSGMSPFQRF
jgi:hypothetical protein